MKNFCFVNSESTEMTENCGRDAVRQLPDPRTSQRDVLTYPQTGWILYDGECRYCIAAAKRFDRLFRRRGFTFIPLQTPWVQKRLGLHPGAPLEEMRVLTRDNQDLGGANAVIFLAGKVWW